MLSAKRAASLRSAFKASFFTVSKPEDFSAIAGLHHSGPINCLSSRTLSVRETGS